jgi:hypothetical protein
MLLSFVKFATKVFFPPFLLSDALHAALRTNVVEGLGAAIRRVSHEQQLWAGHCAHDLPPSQWFLPGPERIRGG